MWRDFDLFELYRWLLGIVCAIYAVVRWGQSLHGWVAYLWSPAPGRHVLRHYAIVQLLRVRLRRFTVDLVEIMLLAATLGILLWLHHRWDLIQPEMFR